MARPRTPTKIMELRGAFKKDPQRKREKEPEPNGEIDKTPPKHLLQTQKKAWLEIVDRVPAGVLSDADSIHVEICACLLAEFRKAKGGIDTSRITRLAALLGKLGLDPSSRAGMSIEKPKRNKYADPWDEL